MMKKFIEQMPLTEVIGAFALVDTERIEELSEPTWQNDILPLEISIESGTETWQNVHLSNEVTRQKDSEIRKVLETFKDVLSDVPGTTNLIKHNIKVDTSDLVRFIGHQGSYNTQHLMNEKLTKC